MVIRSTQAIPSSSTALPILRSLPIWTRNMSNHNGKSTTQRRVFHSVSYHWPKTDPPQEHLRAWLADSLGRDQYVTYRGDEVSIRWHGRPSQSEVAYEDHVRITSFGLISHSTIAGRSNTCEQNYTSRGHHSVHTSPPSTDKASDYTVAPPSNSELVSSTPSSVSSTFRLASNTS